MSVEVKLTCNGCFEEVSYKLPDVDFKPVWPNSNWSKVVFPKVGDNAPEGWWVYDPYTYCQYCPVCREAVEVD